MTAPPYMRWYPSDYFADTMHLNRDENSAYRDLLDHSWLQGGKLPDDDNLLARLTRCSLDEWRKLRPTIVHFFKISRGFWINPRVKIEIRGATIRSHAGRDNAAKRWKDKQETKNANGHAKDDAKSMLPRSSEGSVEVRTSTEPHSPPKSPPFRRKRGDLKKNGLESGAAEAPPPVNPKYLNHGHHCMCSNCTRWAALQEMRTA